MIRKTILCFLLALMCGVSVLACGRNKDFYVNESMRRSELVKMGVDRQRDVFRQCSPEVKADLYRFKIKSDLKEDKTLTKEERKLLKEVYRHLKPEIYQNPKDKAETTFREYVASRLGALGWDEEKSFKYLETIMTAALPVADNRLFLSIMNKFLVPIQAPETCCFHS